MSSPHKVDPLSLQLEEMGEVGEQEVLPEVVGLEGRLKSM